MFADGKVMRASLLSPHTEHLLHCCMHELEEYDWMRRDHLGGMPLLTLPCCLYHRCTATSAKCRS